MRSKRYTETDLERARNQGWRKGYALAVSLKEQREATNELGYAARIAKLKRRHANELRAAVDRASNAAYTRGYEGGVRKMQRNTVLADSRAEKTCPVDHEGLYNDGYAYGKEYGENILNLDRNRLVNDAYMEGREEGRAAATAEIKRERKEYLAQVKRTARAAGELDGYARAIRILKDNEAEVLPF